MSNFKKGFGDPEPMQAKSYVQPDVWLQPVFAQNWVISSEGTSGYQCTLCGVYAEKENMLEHVPSNERFQRAGTSPYGVWANPSPGPVAALSGAASGSGIGSNQPGKSFEEISAAGLNVTQGPAWEDENPWKQMTGARSSTQPSMTPVRPQEAAWRPATVESGEVQRLTGLPEDMGLRVPGEARVSLPLIEMARRFPDQGVVVPGSSFWIADSGLQCVRTKTQMG